LVDDTLPKIGAPATRALASIGVTRLSQVVNHRARDLLAVHGLGPRAIRLLQEALDEQGLSFRADGPDR
jgi:predicted Fe-Mo cluster-binding NifX family protein